MPEYKHGTYGEFAASMGGQATQGNTVAVYVGIAPVNLVRGYSKFVNTPVKLTSFESVKRSMGYTPGWDLFDLCEAFYVHFNNPDGNVGPIVAINVLNPAVHKKEKATSATLTFVNGRATIKSDTIILDTLLLSNMVEGTDYSVDYDFARGQVVITSLRDDPITEAVNITYHEVDPLLIAVDDLIGDVTDGGVYTGLGCVDLIYPELGLIPNLILSPAWSYEPDVYRAMVKAATKINGHWDAFVYADIPQYDAAKDAVVDTIDKAIAWQAANGYTSERSKVCWPATEDKDGRYFHISVLAAWRSMMVDASHDGVPMETCSNKPIPVVKQAMSGDDKNRGFDQQRANKLNANGITTAVYWGGQWVLWGPHTAAYKHGEAQDERVIFDNTMRMMMYVLNSFQQEHALTIDKPMTRQTADTIRNREQEKADALVAIGAIIGNPVVEFREGDNSTAELVQGNFVWVRNETYTTPFKSGLMRVGYTTDGFASFFEEVE